MPHLLCPASKIVAIVETDVPDRNNPFSPTDPISERIADNVIDFLENEAAHRRLPRNLLPIQSGVGNIANAVLDGFQNSPFERLTAYTEVVQDGMLRLLESGKLVMASATALSLSTEAADVLNGRLPYYRERIILAATGNQQPPRDHPPPRLPGDERDGGGRYLRQHQLDPHHGHQDSKWHRRLR